jgi:hypothetical protein
MSDAHLLMLTVLSLTGLVQIRRRPMLQGFKFAA